MGGKANAISDASLRRKWAGADRWLSDGGSRGAGRLVAKVSQAGVTFYFAYFDSENRRRFLTIGPHDASGRRGISLVQARDRAADLSKRYRDGARDLHAVREAEERALAASRAAEQAELERQLREAQQGTLRKLLDEYADHLESKGKTSAADARRIFRRHVFEAWPVYTERKAAELRPSEVTTILRGVTEKGKGRTAAKLRSYLRAAYALALKAEHDATAPAVFRSFAVENNPVAATASLAEFNRVRDRTLTAGELAAYLRALEALPEGPARDALLLALLLGGQRPTQLLRATVNDVDTEAGTITLRDPKGRRTQARRHVLPLTKQAAEIIERLLQVEPVEKEGEAATSEGPQWLFSSDGLSHTRIETLGTHVRDISAALAKDPELKRTKASRGPFDLRDIRRTCETMLAALGISRDVRAQLQSHGLGGIQQRHYDRHDYMDEKRSALEAWCDHLDRLKRGAPSGGRAEKVVPIRIRKAAA